MALIKKTNREWLDLSIVLVIAIIFAIFSISVSLIERLYNFFKIYQGLPVAEFLTNFVFLTLAGVLWLSYHRWRQVAAKQAELENIIDSINPDVLVVVDPDRNIIMCNPSVKQMFGYEVDEVINQKTDILYFDRRSNPEQRHEIFDKLEREGFQVGLATGKKVNGKKIPLEIITGNLRGRGGAVLLLRDITERKQAEERLKVSKRNFHNIVERSADGIVVVDGEGKVCFVNQAAATLCGQRAEEFLGKPFDFPVAAGETTEIDITGDQGETSVGEMRVVDTEWEGKPAYLALLRDITDRKRAEKEIRRKKEFSEALIESISPAVLLVVDRERTILQCNKAIEKVFGYSPQEVIGKKTELLYANRSKGMEDSPIWKILDEEGVHVGEAMGKSKDGRSIDLEISTAIIRGKRGAVLLVRDITEQKRAERRLTKAKEHAEKAERTLKAKNAELIKINQELRDTRSQLLQTEKMASIGLLAAGVAHEINNPTGFVSSNLNTVKGYIEDITKTLGEYERILSLCMKKDDQELLSLAQHVQKVKEEIGIDFLLEDIDNAVNESLEGTKRISEIVGSLSNFAHMDEARLKQANINEGIESILNIVWNELKYKADVIKEYGDLPDLECYPQQLGQVFMNILVNAAQAIEERGKIWIRTYTDDESICVEVKDNGKGMSQEVKERIFDPFFTTKEIGKGTGLGLSMAYGIVKTHKGEIEVESEEGKGTTIRIKLPIEGIEQG